MPEAKLPIRLTPTRLIVLPFVTLSIVFALIVIIAIVSDTLEIASPSALLIAGTLLYAATIFFLSRSTFANVRKLKELSSIDTLSGLPNRRALHAGIEAHSHGDEEVAIALIDLDGFSQVNDRYGHAFGDELIQKCSTILQKVYGNEATGYRLGGDEFAVVVHGRVAGTILEGLSRSFLQELNEPIEIAGRKIAVGASIGFARSTADERLPSSEMLRRADVAMFMSKRSGKMRCTWFAESFDQRRDAVRELEDDLRQGLADQEFALAYQPLVDAQKGKIVAVEALLRWERKDGRSIGPHIFIPVAEESGLINPIGLWVLREAIATALDWEGITLSVNISAAQLRDPEFPIKLGEILEETGFPPNRLELEVTETCLVLDPVVAERTLNVLRQFGVRISLDDFGTGYASIGFLRQFRFEKLKLDRSLVVDAGADEGSRAMMVTSVALARALDMGVTAEGVETEEQAEMVRTAGCDQIQGWLYYKAMPAPDVGTLIKRQRQNGNDAGGNAAIEKSPASPASKGKVA